MRGDPALARRVRNARRRFRWHVEVPVPVKLRGVHVGAGGSGGRPGSATQRAHGGSGRSAPVRVAWESFSGSDRSVAPTASVGAIGGAATRAHRLVCALERRAAGWGCDRAWNERRFQSLDFVDQSGDALASKRARCSVDAEPLPAIGVRPPAFENFCGDWFGHASVSRPATSRSSLLERAGASGVRWTVDQHFGSQVRGMSCASEANG